MSLLSTKLDSSGWVGEAAQMERACLKYEDLRSSTRVKLVSDDTLYQLVLHMHHPTGLGWEQTPWTAGMRTELT